MKPEASDQLWKICMNPDLRTSDPYDVWKTKVGVSVKRNYYKGNALHRGIAGAVYLADLFLNNRLRLGYKKQEYSIVRALAAQILTERYLRTGQQECLEFAELHAQWLLSNPLPSGTGMGWGLGFDHPVSASIFYSRSTPFSTITPYVLEALVFLEKVSGQQGKYRDACRSIRRFFDSDIRVLERTEQYEVTSYGPLADRRVANAVSYTMYSLILLNNYFGDDQHDPGRTRRLFTYLKTVQQEDGSWLYSDEGESFIDCFHSCIILKNLVKSRSNGFTADGLDDVIAAGYRYLKIEFRDPSTGLYKRFTRKNKPDVIRYDLYDNAEMLQCAVLMDDPGEARSIRSAIRSHFIHKDTIYSGINIFGGRQNPRMLRWAIMPYLYSLNLLESYEHKN